MKKFIFSLALLALIGSANSSFASEGEATCTASTLCVRYCMGPMGAYPCPAMINCTVTGDAKAKKACSSAVNPGKSVECHGLDSEGTWVDLEHTCNQ